MLRKMFRERPPRQWKIVKKDLVDEIIFRTMKPRNRIMLELMARGGMRVGEVLKIRPMDIQDRKITLPGRKSGKESEVVFIPQKVADRLKEYVKYSGAGPEQRLFPISYKAARIMVRKAGSLVGIHLLPHDLRRCSHLRLQIRHADRNCQQGDHATCASFRNSAVSREGHGH